MGTNTDIDVAWSDNNYVIRAGNTSPYAQYSNDGGTTWKRPVAVGASPADPGARRVMTLAVNTRGVVGVLIVERHGQTGDGCHETTFAASFDGGATFAAPQRVSASPSKCSARGRFECNPQPGAGPGGRGRA